MRLRPATALAATLLVAACSGSDKDAAHDDLGPGAPGAETIDRPVTRAAPDDFVRRYYASADLAISSSDTRELQALSVPRCPCRDLVRLIQTLRSQGRHLVGTRFVLLSVTVLVENERMARVEVRYRRAAEYVVGSRGAVLQSLPPREALTVMVLVADNTTWRVANSIGVRS